MPTASTRRLGGVTVAVLAVIALFLTLLPPPSGEAADHLDAPGLTPPGGNPQADINDLYAFAGSDTTTVLAMTLVPAAVADSTFSSDVLYEFKIDTDGDAVEDESFEVTFSDIGRAGSQFVVVRHAFDEAARNDVADGDLAAFGQVGKTLTAPGGAQIYTGLRSDPFFFDLEGFQGTVEGADNDREFNDGNESDFFEPLDALAVVAEVPDFDDPINVWATTSGADGEQIDRIGRPAINTVVNSKAFGDENDKNVYNGAEPVDDSANFRGKVIEVLQALSAGDDEGSYTDDQAGALADVLLPDVLPFDKEGDLPPPLNGRGLADDVVDTELRVVTGGDPLDLFNDRDADGAINTDSIPAHEDYLDQFPYLGEPHADVTYPELEGRRFVAALSGDNEVPPVDSSSSGITALGAFQQGLAHLSIGHRLQDLVAGHIHIGDRDENGPVVALLYESEGEDVNGLISRGVVEDGDLVASNLESLYDVLNGGFGYVNFHTTANPGGEIRGQIVPLAATQDAFGDDDGSVHEANIDIIAGAGITYGCNPPENTEFCPDDSVTRGQMAAFLSRTLNLDPVGDNPFTDTEDSVFVDDITAISEVGITFGCNPPENDEYCPEESLTREQMAAFIVRAWDLPASDTDAFTDDDDSIFEDDINALAEADVTQGCNPPVNDQFCPEREMSRSEMASFLARALGWGN